MSEEQNDKDQSVDKDQGVEPAQTEAPEINSWEEAFAALEPEVKEDPKGDDNSSTSDGEPISEPQTDTSDTGEPQTTDAALATDNTGGQLPDDSGDSRPDPDEVIAELTKANEQQAIQDVANLMVEKGIRRDVAGRLGANINDPDIYKKDEDGIPTFYNPDTGEPFTGDNPRAQAKQWVDSYNDELKDTFNALVQQATQKKNQELEPVIQALKFEPIFDKLDPTRQRMFESIVEDYELKNDDGETIGYSCDLNTVLNQVNRQVQRVQEQNAKPKAEPTSPAVDMKHTPVNEDKGEFTPKTLEEAMEYEQDMILNKLKGGK
jgi:hypothetical protein